MSAVISETSQCLRFEKDFPFFDGLLEWYVYILEIKEHRKKHDQKPKVRFCLLEF